jgi:hypothetical protein
MKHNNKMKNIFADKATLILRKMRREPGKKWVVRGFTGPEGVSLGMAQEVLEAMAKQGYVERIKRGPDSHTLLTAPEQLIKDWLKVYRFDLNDVDTYYTPDNNILNKIKAYIEEDRYAFTLHTGTNLITSYVKTDQIYLYLDTDNWDKDILNIRQKLDLKELVRGGNVHIIHPFYKNSVFFNCQNIRGYRVVSNLQLYLDLYNFQPRGREHAEFLKKTLEEKGESIE